MPPDARSATTFTTREIRDLFKEEVEALGGTVRDAFDDGHRLFLRGILTNFRPVGDADDVQAGVALRAEEAEVCIRPYVFRLICANGAIWAHALEAVQIEDPLARPSTEIAPQLREGIRSCASPSAFANATEQMRGSRDAHADMEIMIGAMYSQFARGASARALNRIMHVFAQDGDGSRFGLMNAITAVARDTPDPELRWRLEEFGGGVPAGHVPPIVPVHEAKSLREAYGREHTARMADDYSYAGEQIQELAGSCR